MFVIYFMRRPRDIRAYYATRTFEVERDESPEEEPREDPEIIEISDADSV